jgi:GcvH upstream region-like protein
MLEFLRKYQRYFFLLITSAVIASFVFFGTFSTYMDAPERKDRVVGKAIDGSDMRLLELQDLARFLAVDREDFGMSHKITPNLLNDGVIRRDLISSGIAETLVQKSFDLLKGGLEQKLQRVKVYRPYEHPEASFVSAKAVWERFAPAINRECSALQSTETIDQDVFTRLAKLYQFQSALPPEWLRKMLMLHEQQYNWLHPDPRLRQDDFSLFGFHSVADWFGNDFLDLAAQFIHNGAIEAEKKGIVVTLNEAKADLRKNYAEVAKKFQEAKTAMPLTYKDQLKILGMDENGAAAIWRKVLLFRRYFNDVGQCALLDRLPYSEYASIATEKADVVVYQWPKSLKLKTAQDLLAFQTYLKAVYPAGEGLSLPSHLLTIEEVEKKAPEMVATLYSANISVVDKREASLKAPLKEIWEFETKEDNWKALKREFPFLQSLTSSNEDQRFQALESLDPVNRSKVDLFARRKLLEKHPEWIDEALLKAEAKEKQLVLSAGAIRLPHIDNPHRLGSLFQQILSNPEESLMGLAHFDSGEAVFRFENIAKISDRKIKTFEEATQDGSLKLVTDKILETEFSKLKSKLPEEKQSKSLADVREEIAELYLTDSKKQIVKAAPKEEIHFASLRLFGPAVSALSALKENPEDPRWIKTAEEDPLLAQFKLERVEKQIARSAQEDWMSNESFILVPKEWSPVHVAPDGGISFIYLKDRKTTTEPILDQIAFGKEMLSADVQRVMAEKLLGTMLKKQAIVIPLQADEE